ncbi:MAG TPA: DedA family protein [Methylomirabilota bacterium]|nr:DedA family protein [Methylomirabilota bacterium]
MATWTAGLDTLLRDGSLVYLGLFLATLIDATGFPFPGRVILVAAGAAMARDWAQVAAMTAAGALGAIIGDHLWYMAGRFGAGARLTALYCKLSLASGRCEARARARFDRFGPLAIVIGRFVAGVRILAAPMAGGGAITYPRFLVVETIGAVAWAGLFVVVGYALGAQWRALFERFGGSAVVGGLFLLTVAGPAAIILVRMARRRRHGPARSVRA